MNANSRLALGLGIVTFAGTAFAASDAPDAALQEIVVTAQKRSENLQDVPIAISTVSGDALAATNASSITALADVTPGLQMSTTQGSLSPRIRGVGSNLPNVENSVAMYVDGVYIATPSASLLTLNNIAQVETLKGPQGTLFGRNATGGALLIQTREPTQDLSSHVDVEYGNYNTSTLNAYVADGLAPSVAADFAVHVSHQGEGYGRNYYTGDEIYQTNLDLGLRSKWVFTLSDADTLHLIFDYTRRDGSAATANYIPAGTYPSAFLTPAPAPQPRPYDVDTLVNPTDSLTGSGVSARIDHEMSWAKLVSITAYREQLFTESFDITATTACCLTVPIPFPPYSVTAVLPIQNPRSRDAQVSEELQLLSPNNYELSWLTWVTGLYYFHDREFEESSFAQILTNSYSGFGETHIEFLPATHLTLGLRYTDEDKELSVTPGYYDQPVAPSSTVPPLTAVPTTWFSALTYRAGLDHKFDNGILIYASRNLGFKSGGYNSTEPSLAAYAPEKLNSYEAGIKSEFLDHRVRLNGAVFDYNYTNIQMIKLTSNNQLQEYNGPRARSFGADFDLAARVTQALSLNLGGSYVHDRFTAETPTVQYNVPYPAFPGGSNSFFASANGNRLPDTPDWTINLGPTYVLRTASGDWTFDANYLHDSGWYGEPDNQLRQSAYNSVNASVNWHIGNGPYTVGLWGRNLTDSLVYTAVSGNSVAGLAQYAPPRTYGIRFGADF
jgi:iron complex outermembrane receptor protein